MEATRAGKKVAAIIVAGGSSTRMGGTDKLTLDLCGRTVLSRTLQAFEDCGSIDHVILVASKARASEYAAIISREGFSKVKKVCTGGKRRQDSVAAGLSALGGCDYVIVHDAARPFVTQEMMEAAIGAVAETGVAIAAVPVIDTIKMAHDDGTVASTIPRHKLWAVQTPQIFDTELLKKAHATITDDVTDDASMAERLGSRVKLFTGSHDNIKITMPTDISVAAALWQRRKQQRQEQKA